MELEKRMVGLERSLDRQRKNQQRPAIPLVCWFRFGRDVCGEGIGGNHQWWLQTATQSGVGQWHHFGLSVFQSGVNLDGGILF